MSIAKITEEQRLLLQRISVYALSTRPAEQGKKEADVKSAMFAPVDKICDFIDGIVDATNVAIDALEAQAEYTKPTVYKQDELTQQINHTFVHNEIKAYMGTAQSVKIAIPADAQAGFYSGIEFNTGEEPPTVTFESNGKRLCLVQYGGNIGEYHPAQNSRVTMYAFSNGGTYVDVFITEFGR